MVTRGVLWQSEWEEACPYSTEASSLTQGPSFPVLLRRQRACCTLTLKTLLPNPPLFSSPLLGQELFMPSSAAVTGTAGPAEGHVANGRFP